MNERISEIANQLGFFGPNFLVSTQELEKFAELIVGECAGIAHGSDTPSKDIKEHFGVQE